MNILERALLVFCVAVTLLLGVRAADEVGALAYNPTTFLPSTGGNVTGGLSVNTGVTAADVGGMIHTDTTPVGNFGGGTDNLMTYSLPANTLGTNGQSVVIQAWGTFASNANLKTLTAAFGATTVVSTGAVGFNGLDWLIEFTCIRTGAATQDCIAKFMNPGAIITTTVDFTTPTETLSGALTIKLTGTGTADNDIVQEGWTIMWNRE